MITICEYQVVRIFAMWDDQVRKDMDLIGWNPFNDNENNVLDSKKVSFYKGQLVIRCDFDFTGHRSFSFGIMFLESNVKDPDTVKHEWGHYVQLGVVGVARFLLLYGIPSMLSGSNPKYYSLPWERSADIFGGIAGRNLPYTANSDIYSILYFIYSFTIQ